MGNKNMVRNNSFDIICDTCGKEFKSKVSNAKRCPSCRIELKRARYKTHREKPLIRKPKSCGMCHEEFVPASNNVKYCDRCKEKRKELSHLRKPITICPTCNSYYVKTGNNQKRCKTCQFKQLYSNNYRTIAFENFSHICSKCGKELDIFSADVHHKDRNRENNTLENLEILCKGCHHKLHIVRDHKTGKIITNK